MISVLWAEPHIQSPSMASAEAALDRAVSIVGSATALAELLGIKPQAVSPWRRVPPARAIEVERATEGRVTRHELRPDFYPPEEPEEDAA